MKRSILNTNSFDNWKEIDSQNWHKYVGEIIQVFFDVGNKQYEELHNAKIKKNIKEIKRIAHALKSSCGNVGAEQAYDILDAIEKHEVNSITEFYTLLDRFESVFILTLAELQMYSARQAA